MLSLRQYHSDYKEQASGAPTQVQRGGINLSNIARNNPNPWQNNHNNNGNWNNQNGASQTPWNNPSFQNQGNNSNNYPQQSNFQRPRGRGRGFHRGNSRGQFQKRGSQGFSNYYSSFGWPCLYPNFILFIRSLRFYHRWTHEIEIERFLKLCFYCYLAFSFISFRLWSNKNFFYCELWFQGRFLSWYASKLVIASLANSNNHWAFRSTLSKTFRSTFPGFKQYWISNLWLSIISLNTERSICPIINNRDLTTSFCKN